MTEAEHSIKVTSVLLNKMKKLSLLASLFIAVIALGQQTSQYGNASFNPFLINPAAGGMSNVMQYELTYRTQWVGYNGGPRTALFAGNSVLKLGSKNAGLSEFNYTDNKFFALPKRSATGEVKHVLGGIAYNDAIGPFSKTSVQLTYAIHLPLTSTVNIGAGLGIGWSNLKLDESRVKLYDEVDYAYSQFLGSTSNYNGVDASGGIIIYNTDFAFGLSTKQLLNNKVMFDGNPTESNLARHYFFHGAYRLMSDETISIEPNVVGKFTPHSPSSIDAGVRFYYKNSSWLNLQYRTSNSFVVRIGTTLVKNLYLAYGYEMPTGKISGAASSSHEIQLGIFLGNNRNLNKEIDDSIKQSEDGATE